MSASRGGDLLSILLLLGYRWLEKLDADKARAFRAAVRDDPAGEWLRDMGGVDRRDRPGSADAGGRRD